MDADSSARTEKKLSS